MTNWEDLKGKSGTFLEGQVVTHAEGALARTLTMSPDIVLMDVRMGDDGDASGIEACRDIRAEQPEVRVIMFTSFADREAVLSAIVAGAAGYLTKNISQARLVESIRAVGRGESILNPSVTRDVISRLAELSDAPQHEESLLSDRGKEVLAPVAKGQTNKEIASALVVSPFTARNHVTRILEKPGVSRRSEAAAQAVRLGLIRDEED